MREDVAGPAVGAPSTPVPTTMLKTPAGVTFSTT